MATEQKVLLPLQCYYSFIYGAPIWLKGRKHISRLKLSRSRECFVLQDPESGELQSVQGLLQVILTVKRNHNMKQIPFLAMKLGENERSWRADMPPLPGCGGGGSSRSKSCSGSGRAKQDGSIDNGSSSKRRRGKKRSHSLSISDQAEADDDHDDSFQDNRGQGEPRILEEDEEEEEEEVGEEEVVACVAHDDGDEGWSYDNEENDKGRTFRSFCYTCTMQRNTTQLCPHNLLERSWRTTIATNELAYSLLHLDYLLIRVECGLVYPLQAPIFRDYFKICASQKLRSQPVPKEFQGREQEYCDQLNSLNGLTGPEERLSPDVLQENSSVCLYVKNQMNSVLVSLKCLFVGTKAKL